MEKKQNRSRSDVQQQAENKLLKLYNPELKHGRIFLTKKIFVDVDGYSKRLRIACEVWAHIGKPKAAQKHKVMNDGVKLLFLEKILGYKLKKVILFADERAAAPFNDANSWMALCFKTYEIEIVVKNLSKKEKGKIQKAQIKQSS
ncbi:MAG: hypothetical protein HY434_01070 [Candidatus Liptonbacteria bacterium]|nr:hypothetical protein [Candidatus Niyogibacteria bacterium]MBI4087405.1 hypothetical protein [Candidatus Liptonbacteria bacterium]